MYVTSRLDHAMHALVVLADADGAMVTGSRLAALEGVSAPYMGGILNDLRHGGLLTAVRGRYGGMMLARPPSEITVADVLAALNIWTVDAPAIRVPTAASERVDRLWRDLDEVVARFLASTSLADVARGLVATGTERPRRVSGS